VLCFHSITTRDDPADGTAHISLDEFRSCIRAARQWGEFVPLSELINRHRIGRPTSGLIAVTFDDAYAALDAQFLDVVGREAVPIAVFVVIDAAETGAAYWWDRVDDLFARVTPARWRAFEAACDVPQAYRDGQPRAFGPLRPFRQWILAAFAGRWPARFEPELRRLESETGYITRHRAMTFEELRTFAGMPGVEIGVHTVSHPVLPLLSEPEIHREISGGYAALRQHLDAVLPVLAVPYGLYDERTLRLAASAGMIASLTLSGETVGASRPRDAVPRICITRTDSRARLGIRLLGVPRMVRACCRRPLSPYPALPSATT